MTIYFVEQQETTGVNIQLVTSRSSTRNQGNGRKEKNVVPKDQHQSRGNRKPKTSEEFGSSKNEPQPELSSIEKGMKPSSKILDIGPEITAELNKEVEPSDRRARFNKNLVLIRPKVRVKVDEYDIV